MYKTSQTEVYVLEMFYQDCCPTLTVELWFRKFNVHVLSAIKKLENKSKKKKKHS